MSDRPGLLDLIPGIPASDREALAKMWGGEIHETWGIGARPAVIVVDMTEAFVRDEWPTGWGKTGEPCAQAIARLLKTAKSRRVPIVYTKPQLTTHQPEVGAWLRGKTGPSMFPFAGPPEANEIVPELQPAEDDIVISKPKPSGFFATQLASILTHLAVDTTIVCGMTTSGCVRATVNDAFAHNYRVIVPVECVADRSQLSHRVELFDMGTKYADIVSLENVIVDLEALNGDGPPA